jgi:hypothetical protein
LAAFETAHVVPDEDNAAIIYAELLRGEEVPLSSAVANLDPLMAAVQDPVSYRGFWTSQRKLRELEPSEQGLDPNGVQAAISRPWRSAEHPELKRWLDGHRHRIDRMLEASRKPSCRFPLLSTEGCVGLLDVPLGMFRQNVFLLRLAANNDLGEGDVDAAVSKWRALMVVGRHFREQPDGSHFLSGIACEAGALGSLKELVVGGPALDRHLRDLADYCGKADREWESIRRDINRVRDIFGDLCEDRRVLKYRIYMRFRRLCHGDRGWLENRTCEQYRRLQSDRQGLRILIELRRFKDRAGRWPETLDLIAPSLSPGIPVDPINGGPYVYRGSADSFSLYSRGPNSIDEQGRHTSDGPDDWPIWPPRGQSPEPEQKNP